MTMQQGVRVTDARNTMDRETLGARLRARREQAGFSQTDVAKQTGIIQRDISLLERGKKHALWVDTLLRLATTLGCSLDYLVGLTDDPTPATKRPRPRTAAPVG
jgi:transcriptional regulator with XRE-family HTH domain